MATIRNRGKSPFELGYHWGTVTFSEHVRRMRAFRKYHPRRRDPRAVLFIGISTLRLTDPYRERGGASAPLKDLLNLVPGAEAILPKGSSN